MPVGTVPAGDGRRTWSSLFGVSPASGQLQLGPRVTWSAVRSVGGSFLRVDRGLIPFRGRAGRPVRLIGRAHAGVLAAGFLALSLRCVLSAGCARVVRGTGSRVGLLGFRCFAGGLLVRWGG